MLFQGDEELRVNLTAALRLEDAEVALLMEEPESSHAVKHLLEKAALVAGARAPESKEGSLPAFDEDDADAA